MAQIFSFLIHEECYLFENNFVHDWVLKASMVVELWLDVLKQVGGPTLSRSEFIENTNSYFVYVSNDCVEVTTKSFMLVSEALITY